MFKEILCPVDFTTYSHHALEYAVGIARCHGAAITGVHVVAQYRASRTTPEAAVSWTSADLARMEAQVLRHLHEVDAPSPRAIAVLGDPAVEIVKVAISRPTDLIVMPSRGRTGLAEGSCGSVTEQVLYHSPSPVITVPAGNGSVPDSTKGFQRIVCAIDFSPASLKALRYASALVEAERSRLVVVHVLEPETVLATATVHPGSPESSDARSIWRRRLHEATDLDLPKGADVQERLSVGDPATEILRLAEDENADLAVIGGHRGNPPGCVMNALVIRSRCPLLAVRVSR